MSIGKNIYDLRKSKKWTQGQLAEKLGISEQAVSKWENDICAPDVSLFPVIAELFGVSIDRLYGFHLNSYAKEVGQIIKAADDSRNTQEELRIITEGLKRYPNSAALKNYLAFSLSMVFFASQDEKERSAAAEQAIRICDEIVASCADSEQVDSALTTLCVIYQELGEYQKAQAAIDKISAQNYGLRVSRTAQVLENRKYYTEHARYAQENLWKCYWTMQTLLNSIISVHFVNQEYEQALPYITALQKLLPVFDDGCSDFNAAGKMWACERKATAYGKLRDKQACLQELREFLNQAERAKAAACTANPHISARNQAYFAHVEEPNAMESLLCDFELESVLSRFDRYFEGDAAYRELRQKLFL